MAISFDVNNNIFFLDGKATTYAIGVNEFGYVEHLYYGRTIGHDDLTFMRGVGGKSATAYIPGTVPENGKNNGSYHNFPSELSFFGTGDYREPAVIPVNFRGDRITELLYDSHEILTTKPAMKGMPSMRGGETLVLHLKDWINGFACDLYFTVYDDTDVIARRAVYINGGHKAIKLERAYTFTFTLPSKEYEAISLYGAWAKERKIERISLHHGVVSIDSKRATSSATLNPFIALAKKDATEENGEVYGFSLIYSSSYVLKAEVSNNGTTLVTGGINDFGFSWKLETGKYLETPEVVIAYSDQGIGGMSRCYHDAYRNHLINPRFAKKARPVVINNWEGTYFDFDLDKLKAIAKAVEGSGIDTFVLDDGWFGKRSDDKSGLGDWVVNENKIQGGLTEIIGYVNSMGMRFGLWFEPEMISEDSDLYRAHPDYAIGLPDRPRCKCRNQYVLDLTREDVRDYIVAAVNKVLQENNIEYVKWDYNRNVTEFYSLKIEAERQGEFTHRYALGLYDLCKRIVEANPKVLFEGCAGGGARFDPAMLHYFPQIWTSDNTDAEARTWIQYGTSIVYPLSSMSCHVSVVPNHQTGRIVPIETRADIAHLGATGYELDTTCLSDEDKIKIAYQVAEYHEMEDLVLNGDLYRTENPLETNYFGFMLVSKDKSNALLTVYCRLRTFNEEIKYFKVAGLDANKRYYVPELERTLHGSTLMNIGIVHKSNATDFSTEKYHFIAV